MTLTVTPTLLGRIPLLAGLDEARLAVVAGAMQVRSYAKRDFVIHKGSPGDALYFLLAGRLLVVDVTPDGRQIGLNFLTPGDFFGEVSVIDGQPRSASLVAVSASQVALLPKKAATALIYHTPLIAERMLQHIAGKLRASTDFRALLGIPNAFHRVYTLIQLLAKPDPGKLLTIENMPTHQHIALMANTSRETVTRALLNLHQQGVIEKDNQRLIIRSPEKLGHLLAESEDSHAPQ